MRLAERLGGTIVNADSMQVYRDLRVLTARPGAADEAAFPHRLYGHVDGAAAYSVARWLGEAANAIAEVRAEGRVPIVVGGTGLYLAALTQGLSTMPPVPDEVRTRWRAAQAAHDAPALHAMLAARDPEMAARLRPSDPQRIVRALEVVDATGRSLAAWQAQKSPPVLPVGPGVPAYVVAPPRDLLRRRIAERFALMVEEGGAGEAAALAARALDPALPVMKAIGVAELAAAARGEMSLEEAAAAAVTATRQYAKRQDTWFRHRFAAWQRLAPGEMPALP